MLNVSGEPRLFALNVKVVFRLVAWCGTTRGRGSGWVRIGVERRDAVDAKCSDGTQEGVSPDGSAKVFAWILLVGSSRGRRSIGAKDACRVKRSHSTSRSGSQSGQSGCASKSHAGGGGDDHFGLYSSEG